jgi:hypothetical protein
MNNKNDKIRLVSRTMVIFLLGFTAFPTTAMAYVDPGSGSVIVTTILGLIAAIGYTFRKYFYKIKRVLTGKDSTSTASRPDQDEL